MPLGPNRSRKRYGAAPKKRSSKGMSVSISSPAPAPPAPLSLQHLGQIGQDAQAADPRTGRSRSLERLEQVRGPRAGALRRHSEVLIATGGIEVALENAGACSARTPRGKSHEQVFACGESE